MNQNSEGIYLTSFQRQLLREHIATELPAAYRQRVEIVLLTDEGKTQAEICRSLGCSAATASRWMQLTKAGLAHQYLDCPVGRPKLITDEYIELLRELLGRSPRDYGYPFKTWTVSWLGKHIAKEKGIAVSHSHLKRVMRELGLSTRSQLNRPDKQSSANISIADLSDRTLPAAEELSELNLFHIQLNSKIYGAAVSVSTYFAAATQRDFLCFDRAAGLSILP
ncbi:helix-turn-helix domain-containing protein [Chamaesiphon polymorphus]|nr:helix-turn-helix domain-containing protein [Chamaesiphon polymorphus]